MRKFICVFMAIAMVFTCTIFSSSAQSIDNVQLQPMPTDTSLYISTEACPDAYITYVNQNVHRFIESVSFTVTHGEHAERIQYFRATKNGEIVNIRAFVGKCEWCTDGQGIARCQLGE